MVHQVWKLACSISQEKNLDPGWKICIHSTCASSWAKFWAGKSGVCWGEYQPILDLRFLASVSYEFFHLRDSQGYSRVWNFIRKFLGQNSCRSLWKLQLFLGGESMSSFVPVINRSHVDPDRQIIWWSVCTLFKPDVCDSKLCGMWSYPCSYSACPPKFSTATYYDWAQ